MPITNLNIIKVLYIVKMLYLLHMLTVNYKNRKYERFYRCNLEGEAQQLKPLIIYNYFFFVYKMD